MTALLAIPAWLLLLIAIVLFVGVACGGHLLVRRAFPGVDFTVHNGVGGVILGIVGSLFSVTVAFIILIVWQEYDGTSLRVATEVGAANDLWHTSVGLPEPVRDEVRRNLVAYGRLMISDEWPAMHEGGSSERAEYLLTRTLEDVARLRATSPSAEAAQTSAMQYLGMLHDSRTHRLDDNASGVSAFEWMVLFIGAGVIIGICYVLGLPNLRTQLLLTGAVAGMIAMMFVLVFELDYPFRGDLAIGSSGWQDFVRRNS
ncbi:MAG: DUF4239 domain-containing protein [Candidatus Eremiobacteraeota bacterium]|nr:DUF4239 domain-containing protein [Candidatus Eremiobacteraeota bacterium]